MYLSYYYRDINILVQDRLQPHSTVHEPVTVTHPTSLDNVHQPSELLQKLNSVSSLMSNPTLAPSLYHYFYSILIRYPSALLTTVHYYRE